MTQEVLSEILAKHELWQKGKKEGKLANLQYASLQDADLRGANMQEVNMLNANLRKADMRGANIDYSAWPLWCGSLKAHVDDRIAIQLLYHALSVVQHSPYVSKKNKTHPADSGRGGGGEPFPPRQ